MWHGCAHTAGLYPDRSGAMDFFTYGANLVKGLGFRTLRFYLSSGYAGRDYIDQTWGAAATSLVALAQKTPVANVLADAGFDRYIISTFAISQPDMAWQGDPGMNVLDYAAEYQEMYDLVVHLLTTYPTKEFIISNWEGDWQLAGGAGRIDTAISPYVLQQYKAYHVARKRAVHDACRATSSSGKVWYTIECNRVLDDFNYRVWTDVLTTVKPDMVSLTIYEAINSGWGSGQAAIEAYIEQLLPEVVKRIRLVVGPAIPIIVGEFGWPQDEAAFNGTSPDVGDLIQKVIDVADAEGCEGCAWWQILDNEEQATDTPRGFGLYDRNGSSSTVGALNDAGTYYQGIL